MMLIRQATPEDAPALALMRWNLRMHDQPVDPATYPEFEAYFSQFIRDALASGRWVVWVAEDDDQVIAQVYVQIIEKVPRPGALHRNFGYVTNVYAHPAYRNQGVGGRLMRHVIEWAKAEPLEYIILWPSPLSVSFYQRMGFEYPTDALQLILQDE